MCLTEPPKKLARADEVSEGSTSDSHLQDCGHAVSVSAQREKTYRRTGRERDRERERERGRATDRQTDRQTD